MDHGQSSPRFSLRSATQPHHSRTEAAFEALNVFADQDGYVIWLTSLRTMHHRFGAALDLVSREFGLPEIQETLIDLIEQDIRAAQANPPIFPKRPHVIPDVNEAMGMAYAMEGSGMGAQILRKRAKSAGCRVPRYIAHLSEVSSERWPVFTRSLDQRRPNMAQALFGATTVFQLLEANMKRGSHDLITKPAGSIRTRAM